MTTLVHRVLSPKPIRSLDEYVERRGARGLDIARRVEPEALIDEIEASGLRGRGGGGFPTHRKWRTVAENRSAFLRATVVVNGAEGEPGTFKDRTILENDPYQVIEGALIAAIAVGADQVVFGLKTSFGPALARVRRAIAEITAAGWNDGISVTVHEGPEEYLFGEETALLESIDGRRPFPRLAPPFRRGVREVVAAERDPASGSSAHIEMAGPDDETVAPPALVDNVETLANVPRIISRGGRWFRTEGTPESPGTIVCTITGATRRAGVGEVIMGTTLREAIDLIGAGPSGTIKAVLPGVANALIPAAALDTPLTYEDMAAIGSGLGSAGYLVIDESEDIVAVAAGASRFLAVESCGQCTPCKQDGLQISGVLERLCRNDVEDDETMEQLERRIATVNDGARCYLATQQQVIARSLLTSFPEDVAAHRDRRTDPVEPALITEIRDIAGTVVELDERRRDKQPDWSYDPFPSGRSPVDALARTSSAAAGMNEGHGAARRS